MKKSDSDGIIRVKIRSYHSAHSSDEIKLNNKLSPSSISVPVVGSQNRSEKSTVRKKSVTIRWIPRESNKVETISPEERTKKYSNAESVPSINHRDTNQQISKSSLNGTENHQDSEQKHQGLCARHFSLSRVFLFLLATVLLCAALAALIVSLLLRPKDTTTIRSMVSILWTFDNNTNDMYNTYNGIAVNAPNYATSYTGLYSQALNLNGSSSQYIKVANPLLEFTYRSFTIEIWFYPTLLTAADFGLFGQCETMAESRCLMLMIKNYCVYFSFYNDDLSGTTALLPNRWHHVAFVYDYSTSTQLLYLNGYLEGSRTSTKYQGASASMTIGAVEIGPSDFFFGYIDQVSLITTVKTASQVLYDATFVCYYSFDTSSYTDSGPWNLTGSNIGLSAAISTGYVNSAVSFTSANTYFLFGGLSLLGTSVQSYSISLWIKPTSVSGGSIVYISKCNTNCASNWCMPFIGFTLSGQIVIQSWSSTSGGTLITLTGPSLLTNVWTHIVHTYSLTNGMRLYLNGLLFRQSSIFLYMGSGSSNYIYLGSFPLTTCTQTAGIISATQYYGILDEYYLYARELTVTEVIALANP